MSGPSLVQTLFKRLRRLGRASLPDYIHGLFAEAVGLTFVIVGPIALKYLVDQMASGRVESYKLALVVLAFAVSAAGANFTTAWRMVFTCRIIDRVASDLIQSVMLCSLPRAARSIGNATSEVQGQLERLPYSLHTVLDGLGWQVVPLAIQVLTSLVVLAGLVPFIYLMTMAATLAAYLLVTWAGSRRQRLAASDSNEAAGAASQTLGDLLRNARRVVFNGATAMEVSYLGRSLAHRTRVNARTMRSLVQLSALQALAVGTGLTMLLVLGAGDVGAGRITVGDFVLLQAYALRLAMPLAGFGFSLSQAAVAIGNIREVLDLVDETGPVRSYISPAPAGPAGVSVKGVTFGYVSDLPRFVGFNLEIVAGSFVVIVGPNGGGKSTLAQVMAGILEPAEGLVLVNGHDVQSISPSARHRHVLYVPQLVGLLNRSLADNALYPPTRLKKEGLETLLVNWRFEDAGAPIELARSAGEVGSHLSGGQVQKLELARLTGVSVPVIILDESTSALDPASEEEVLSTLRAQLGPGTTIIMVSHKERLAASADEVVFLVDGRLAGQGGHEDLMRSNDAYRALWTGAAGDEKG